MSETRSESGVRPLAGTSRELCVCGHDRGTHDEHGVCTARFLVLEPGRTYSDVELRSADWPTKPCAELNADSCPGFTPQTACEGCGAFDGQGDCSRCGS